MVQFSDSQCISSLQKQTSDILKFTSRFNLDHIP